MGEKKKFDIKCESDGVRLFQNWPANIQPESFESALGVPERHSGGEAHNRIEDAAGLFAAPRLMNTDQFAIQRPRAMGGGYIERRI